MSVEVSNLVKIYGKQKAVDDVSCTATPGEILGFLGPNGAGKSTTMKIITSFLSPTAGNVKVCGHDINEDEQKVKKCIGYLPEHNPLYLDMYMREYLQFICSLHRLNGKDARGRIEEMIELCGLKEEQNKLLGALSKGYRQRVGLAQALLHDPKVLILDEPTAGLDPNQIVEIRKLIKGISEEKTVIFSTHIMQEVQALCDRVIIINKGRIVADNNIDQLKQQSGQDSVIIVEFKSPVNTELISDVEDVINVQPLSETKLMLHTRPGSDVRPEIFKIAAEKNLTLIGMREEESTMENIFQKLTR